MHLVAPLAGAWIEIENIGKLKTAIESLPSRERGLKFMKVCRSQPDHCRSPRGSVD